MSLLLNVFKKMGYPMSIYSDDDGAFKSTVKELFDGEMKLFHNNKSDYLDLAYAITVHKSQGSEYPNVVMPIVDDHRIMLTRKLIYTAITRGKQNVCLIGSKRVLREALKKVFLNLRYSNLNQKIEKADINLFHQR